MLALSPQTLVFSSNSGQVYPLHHPYGREPRFAGGVDTLARIFQPITEQFVYGFFAQDVIALWIPRIINALRRGRNKYDPNENPEIRNKHPLQQWLHSVYKNIKGLNYSNATEESLREIETGPGLIIAQSILYGLAAIAAAKALWGGFSVVMGYSELRAFKDAYVNMLNSPEIPAFLKSKMRQPTSAFEKNMLERFMKEMLLNGHFSKGLAGKVPYENIRSATEADKALCRFLKQMYPNRYHLPQNARYTYEDAVNAWISKWSELNLEKHGFLDQKFLKRRDELESIFSRIAHWFNDTSNVTSKGFLQGFKPGKLNMLNIPQLGEHHSVISVSEFMENSRKFVTFITSSIGRTRKEVSGLVAKGIGENMKNSLINSAKWILEFSTVGKCLLSLAATLLAGIVVVTVSAFAQKGKAYPANRNVQLNGSTAQPVQSSGSPAPSDSGSGSEYGFNSEFRQTPGSNNSNNQQLTYPINSVEYPAYPILPSYVQPQYSYSNPFYMMQPSYQQQYRNNPFSSYMQYQTRGCY